MRDVISLHPPSAVVDGLSHPDIHRLSPAVADTAVGRETCVLRSTCFTPEGRRNMPVPHVCLTRGLRVREFVCAYRTLRDDQGHTVRIGCLIGATRWRAFAIPTQGMRQPEIDARYFLVNAAARNRSSDSTSAGSATVSAISWRNRSR
jgi:hypothetical protein